MHCTNCGTALSSGTSFCANCGTPATPSASTSAPQYAPQPVPASNYAYAQQPTNAPDGLAIAALVVSVAMLFISAGTLSFIGAILGHVSLSNIKKTGKGGRGLALSGVIIGWSVTALWILAVILIVAVAAGGYNYYSDY
jgi:hypothetical protein